MAALLPAALALGRHDRRAPSPVHPRRRSGHNEWVKIRAGTIVAFGVGYLLGARAGRERYVQIVRLARDVGRSEPVAGTADLVGHKARAAGLLLVERLKDTVGVRLGWRDGEQAADALALDLAEDLHSAINNYRH